MKFKKIVRQINSVTSGINNISSGVNTVTKGVVQAPKKAAQQTLNGLLVPVKAILKLVTSIIVILRKYIQESFLYVKCFIKFLSNFYKCAFFYLLDIIKYLIMTVWLALTVPVVGFMTINNKKYSVKRYAKDVVHFFSKMTYGNKIMNDCYRCKKKKDPVKKSFMQELKDFVMNELNPDVKSRKQPLSFFTILLWASILIIVLVFLTLYVVPGTIFTDMSNGFKKFGNGLLAILGGFIQMIGLSKGNEPNSNTFLTRPFKLWLLFVITLFLVLAINQKWAGNSRYALLVTLVILIFFVPIFGYIGYTLYKSYRNMFSEEIVPKDDLYNKGTEGNKNITSYNLNNNQEAYAPGDYTQGDYSKKDTPLS